MFNIRYDLTKGRLRRGSSRRTVGASSVKRRRTAASQRSGYGGFGLGSGITPAAGGLNQEYSPVTDRAEAPTLGQQFLPGDSASQNRMYEEIATFDPIVSPTLEYWKDLAFSEEIIVSGVTDSKQKQFFEDSLYASGIISELPELLHDFLTFGKFVAHLLYNDSLNYWDGIIAHNLNFLSIQYPETPGGNAIIDIQPTAEQRAWATSKDPRVVEDRRKIDPVIIKLMAAGKQIPLAPENTIFLPRRAFSWDCKGSSYLNRVLIFKVYESAIYNASIAGARRRAGPLLHITGPEGATPEELQELLDLFFGSEDDPVGAKVVTKKDVEVASIGGGAADYWKFSDEWPFLVEGKMRALGVSETLVTGESNWNSMETIKTVFVEKLQYLRSFFTKKILIDKMCRQLAEQEDFVKRKTAEINHRYRIARPKKKAVSDLIIPKIDWNRPLGPTRDEAYMELLRSLQEAGGILNMRTIYQAGGVDIDEELENSKSDLETRKKIYEYKRNLALLRQKMGFDENDTFIGGEEEEGGLGGGLGGFEEEGFGFEEEPGGGFEMEEPAPAAEAPGGGAGAALEKARFPVEPAKPAKEIYAAPYKEKKAQYRQLGKDIINLLEELPLWDENETFFSVPKRRVAQILYKVAQTDPYEDERSKLANTLYKKLRKEGFNDIQAQGLLYVAIRLGYIPPVELSSEIHSLLSHYVSGKMNGRGMTKAIANELVALARLSGHREDEVKPLSVDHMRNLLSNRERSLPHNKTLTGYVRRNELG